MSKFKTHMKYAWDTAKHVIGNEHGWIPLAIAAIGAAATAYSASKSAAATSGGEDAEILPNTVSGNSYSDQDFVFDEEAQAAMKSLTEQMNTWSQTDRSFFEETFQPFQQALIEGNKSLIPNIVENSKESLSQNVSDLVASDHLKTQFRSMIKDSGGAISEFGANFLEQVRNIPSTEQRVGEAVAGIEKSFGQAGAELKRSMAAKGLDVDVASKRALAIAKASAKAGGVQQAKEASRLEQMTASERAVGVASQVQESQANMLTQERGLLQAGANLTPQIGGVQETQAISEAGKVGAELTTTGAERILGQRKSDMNAEFTQAGVVTPKFFDRETGKLVDAAGNEIKTPRPASAPVNTNYDPRDYYFGGGPGGDYGGGAGAGAGSGVGSGGVGAEGVGAGSADGDGGECCFIAGTEILTEHGRMPIELVKPGTEVFSHNFINRDNVFSRVNSTVAVLRSRYYNVILESGNKIGITDDHPMYTKNGWEAIDAVAAKKNPGYAHIAREITDLVVGSELYHVSGQADKVVSIEEIPGEVTTYTLKDVTPARTFYANEYLASNKF